VASKISSTPNETRKIWASFLCERAVGLARNGNPIPMQGKIHENTSNLDEFCATVRPWLCVRRHDDLWPPLWCSNQGTVQDCLACGGSLRSLTRQAERPPLHRQFRVGGWTRPGWQDLQARV